MFNIYSELFFERVYFCWRKLHLVFRNRLNRGAQVWMMIIVVSMHVVLKCPYSLNHFRFQYSYWYMKLWLATCLVFQDCIWSLGNWMWYQRIKWLFWIFILFTNINFRMFIAGTIIFMELTVIKLFQVTAYKITNRDLTRKLHLYSYSTIKVSNVFH